MRSRTLLALLLSLVAAATTTNLAEAGAAAGPPATASAAPATAGALTVAASATAGSRTPLERAVAGIPQSGIRLGRPDAPLAMIVFADLQCPFCARFAATTLPRIVRDWVASGRLQIRYRMLSVIGTDSTRAAQFAVAAGDQGLLWQTTARMFARQRGENTGYVTDRFLRAVGESVDGLDAEEAMARRSSRAVMDSLDFSRRRARQLHVAGVPMLAIRRTDGRMKRFDGDVQRYGAVAAALRVLQRR
ncbi:thioredoxin domain-containing protein [Conexibacter sp. CPCC 206217]|uniref:DsbA family protein n=1 Tax=Conexibacter sp. CPCC 206217 TaxID=3064574 RepID=UPI002716281D|nr:thioredoxin domain-containing protein [Conexibacter sp. CPCC 206217]MDO8210948.1 thioredoxin domain-containing protein [Conexibacter sp. CPCC 206217]